MVVEGLKEFADFGGLVVGEGRELLGDVAEFARHDGPAVLGEPLGCGAGGGAVGDETRAELVGGDVVVLRVSQRLKVIGSGLDGGGFDVRAGVGMVGLDETDVVEEELVAARGAELALLEKNANLRAVRLLLSV